MASPKKNVPYSFYVALVDATDSGAFKANPTIAIGDFQVSSDGVGVARAFQNLATLPVADPAGAISVLVSLSAAEMNSDKVVIQGIDAAGDEWDDVIIPIDNNVVNIEDLVRSSTPANTLNISASGVVDSNITLIDGDATAPAVLANQYNGTGITNDTYPATQAQVTGISNVGSASNIPVIPAPNGFIINLGSGEVNDEDCRFGRRHHGPG